MPNAQFFPAGKTQRRTLNFLCLGGCEQQVKVRQGSSSNQDYPSGQEQGTAKTPPRVLGGEGWNWEREGQGGSFSMQGRCLFLLCASSWCVGVRP